MTTRESDKARAAEGGEHGRAITRGEEARVRALLRDALDVYPSGINLYWSHDDKRMTSVSIDADGQSFRDLTREEIAKAARAGIVPGSDGWCWAPSSSNGPDDDTTARMLGVDIERVRLARERGSKDDQALLARAGFKPGLYGWQWSAIEAGAPPSWLTAAVLAALPADGQPVDLVGVYAHVAEHPDYRSRSFAHVDAQCMAVLAALVASGEIEAGPEAGQWRRWGVPEGFAWIGDAEGVERLTGMIDGECIPVATAFPNGGWRAGTSSRHNVAIPPTLAAARTAALRACYERGAFGPRPVAVPAASRQAYDPMRIRERLAALLAKGPRKAVDLLIDVLATGAPEGFALPDLRAQLVAIGARRVYAGSGEQWEVGTVPDPIADVTPAPHFDAPTAPAPTRAEQVRLALLAVLTRGAVATRGMLLPIVEGEMGTPAGSVEPSEVRQAAREIGAEVDGPRWSLPSGSPPGFQWLKSYTQGEVYYLAPIAYADMRVDQIARVFLVDKDWTWTLCPNEEWDTCDSLADGQTAALTAARRAGLFARPAAVEPPAEPEEFIHVRVARVLGIEVERVLVVSDLASDTIERVEVDGLTVHEETLDKLRAAGIKVRAPDPSASPVNPLVALARHLCGVHTYEPGSEGMRVAMASAAGLTPLLAAWGAALVEQARAPRHAIEAVGEQDGPGMEPIPHATVQASLAARAYATDAPLLYAVWKAATTARDAYRAEGMSSRFSRSLVALWDLLDAAEHKPADPAQPCPACATAERRVAAVEGTCRELDDERAGLQRSLDAAIASAKRAEAKLATLGAEIDALHARWAGAK